MTGPALAAAWAAVVLAAAWRHRPPPSRVAALVDAAAPPAPCRPGRPSRLGPRAGAALAGATVALLSGSFPAGLVAGGAVWCRPALVARRAAGRRRRAVADAVPEAVDLLVLAVDAGLTVPLALDAVAARTAGPLGESLRAVVADVARGRRTADALDDLPARSGAPDEVSPLAAALAACERYGAPLADTLARLADDARAARRRRAEAAARRLPVKLLFPLVCCTLPAFGLLTMAPLIASAVRSLRL